MIYGTYEEPSCLLTEQEELDIENFYENCDNEKTTSLEEGMSLSMLSLNFLMEMHQNSIDTFEAVAESYNVVKEGVVEWIVDKIQIAINHAVSFFTSMISKIRNYFSKYKNEFLNAKNKANSVGIKTWITVNGPIIKKMAGNLSMDQLKGFGKGTSNNPEYKGSVPKYRTDLKDININGANRYLTVATQNYIGKIKDKTCKEELIENLSNELLSEKDKIKATYMKYLFDELSKKNFVSSPEPGPIDKIVKNSLNNDNPGADFSTVIPNDIIDTSGSMDGKVGKVNSTNDAEMYNTGKEEVSKFAKAFFTSTSETIYYDGVKIISSFDSICKSAYGDEFNVVARNFIDADKSLQKMINSLKDIKKDIERSVKDTNNDRINTAKYKILVNVLNLYMTAEMFMATMILEHSVAVGNKMQDYFKLLSNFKKYLENI